MNKPKTKILFLTSEISPFSETYQLAEFSKKFSTLVNNSEDFEIRISQALKCGISEDNIIIDPGIGFGKSISQNKRLINELHYFTELGYPILIGPSRKSFIGYTLNLPVEERLEGTAAAISIGIARGADIIRVHDVKSMARVTRMTDSLVRNT